MILKLPTIHEGVAVRQMEAKGIPTDKGDQFVYAVTLCFHGCVDGLGPFALGGNMSLQIFQGANPFLGQIIDRPSMSSTSLSRTIYGGSNR